MRQHLFRSVLLAWPPGLRDRHGRALVQTLDTAWRHERRWWARAALVADGVHTGIRERRASRRRARLPARKGAHPMMKGLANETRVAVRMLLKRPGFTAAVAATLALGIGATTAIFSVIYGVLLRPLAFDDPDRLVVVWESNPGRGYALMAVAPPNLEDWRAGGPAFEDIGAYSTGDGTLTTPDGSVRVNVTRMTPALLDVLQVRPRIGRPFVEADAAAGAPRVVLLSDTAWRTHFGGDLDVVGRTVTLYGAPAEIVGVMPASFQFPLPVAFEGTPVDAPSEVFALYRENEHGGRTAHYLRAIGRLRPGVTVDTAEAQLRAIAARLEDAYPDSNAGWTVRVVPLAEQVVGQTRPALLALFAAVALVLLLACTNAAHLLLARALDRGREVAVRIALGASRLQLARQFFIEGLLLAVLGAAGGLVIAGWSIRLLLSLAPATIPRLGDVRLDGWTLTAAVAAGVLAAVLSSLAPILHAWRARSSLALRDRSADGASGARSMQRVVVVLEAAAAVVLVVLASLIGQSFLKLRGIDPGFRPENVLMFHVNPSGPGYAEPGERTAFVETMLERLRALPGVVSVGTIDAAPFTDDRQGSSFQIEGAAPFPEGAQPAVNYTFVSPGYFETMGIDLIAGRTFTADDRVDSEPVTIISETFARQFFPDGDAVGRRVFLGFNTQTPRRIVGVVRDERHERIDEPARAATYTPVLQFWRGRFAVSVRTTQDPATLVGPVRSVMKDIDRNLAVFDVRPMTEIVAASFGTSRFATQLISAFAGLALVLAIAGVFGVASHGVSSRTVEIGVRVALGAAPRDVRRAVVRPTLLLVGVGVAAGLALTAIVAGGVEQMLHDTSPLSPTAYATATLVVLFAALGATWIPAQRAARIDPLRALRQD